MAKYECRFEGNYKFDGVLAYLHNGILEGSSSASYEDGSDYTCGELRCAVRVYERYSYFGQNRVSLQLMLAGRDGDLFLSAITSGGSQAMFFKLNTVGEETFLDKLTDLVFQLQNR